MFDFESDNTDPRFARPTEGETHKPIEAEETSPVASPVTRENNRPVIITETPIPIPPPLLRPSSPARERAQRRRIPTTVKGNDWAWVIIAAALIFVFIVLGITLAALINATRQNTESPLATPVMALPTPVDARTSYDPLTARLGQTITLDDGSRISLQPWDGTSRLNILLLGIDRRAGETGLGYRTDTIMLASLDPKTQRIGILSIPRDLYVRLPGYSAPQRINTALALGELQRPGYGPTLAMQTVQGNLGMNVNSYMVADFNALIKLVDSIGGVEIEVPYPIADYDFPDTGYGYDPLILSAGLQHMDGYTAQKYARTRHGDSDFDRARRQQQVLFAIRDQVLSVDILPQLIVQAPSLYGSVSQNVYTDLTLDQMIGLGLWLKDVPVENIHTGVIDAGYVSDLITEDGAQVLVPYTAALPTLLAQVFGDDYSQP